MKCPCKEKITQPSLLAQTNIQNPTLLEQLLGYKFSSLTYSKLMQFSAIPTYLSDAATQAYSRKHLHQRAICLQRLVCTDFGPNQWYYYASVQRSPAYKDHNHTILVVMMSSTDPCVHSLDLKTYPLLQLTHL